MEVSTIEEFNTLVKQQEALLVYFSHEECNVCKVLMPKVKEMLDNEFPKCGFQYINVRSMPQISAQLNIFTVPTISVYFAEKEYIRKSRHIGINELSDEISRHYNLFFS